MSEICVTTSCDSFSRLPPVPVDGSFLESALKTLAGSSQLVAIEVDASLTAPAALLRLSSDEGFLYLPQQGPQFAGLGPRYAPAGFYSAGEAVATRIEVIGREIAAGRLAKVVTSLRLRAELQVSPHANGPRPRRTWPARHPHQSHRRSHPPRPRARRRLSPVRRLAQKIKGALRERAFFCSTAIPDQFGKAVMSPREAKLPSALV